MRCRRCHRLANSGTSGGTEGPLAALGAGIGRPRTVVRTVAGAYTLQSQAGSEFNSRMVSKQG